MPQLSVIMAVYNAMPYLPAAVDSVLQQSYSDFNLFIINDGSTDASLEYLRSVTDPRVHLISRENRGVGATLNELYEMTEAEFVAHMDSDDISLPHRFERQLDFLHKHQEVVMVGTSIEFLVGNTLVATPPRAESSENIREALLHGRSGAVCQPSIMVRRAAWKSAGGYRVSGTGEDMDYFLRLSEVGRIANLTDVLHRYRLHPNSLCSTNWERTRLGHKYAIDCAKKRAMHADEPDYADYLKRWQSRSFFAKVLGRIDAIAERSYRRSIVERASGSTLLSAWNLLIAAGCRPQITIRRVLRTQ